MLKYVHINKITNISTFEIEYNNKSRA